jgi:hypothetical protein
VTVWSDEGLFMLALSHGLFLNALRGARQRSKK